MAITIDSAEEVGIGDTTPDALLDVGDGTNDTEISTTKMAFSGTAKPRRRVFIPANSGQCRTTAGCDDTRGSFDSGSNDIEFVPRFFASDADDHWQTTWTIPENYDGGTFTAQIEWTDDPADAATGGGVSWFVQMMSITNDDPINTAFGTAIEINDDFIAAQDFHTTSESAAITAAGTPLGGHRLWIQVFRDISDSDDDLTGGMDQIAAFLGIWITYSVDQLSTED